VIGVDAIAGSVGPGLRAGLVEVMGRALLHRVTATRRRNRDPRQPEVETVSLGNSALGDSARPETVAMWRPWRSPDSRLLIAFDGEIHNRSELVAAAASRNTAPADRSDHALIAALYSGFGTSFLTRIDGPFAVALVDRSGGRLILARDILGVRPLHYTTVAQTWHFASEVQALVANPAVEPLPNFAAIADQLSHLHLSGNGTFFEGIWGVPPGHALLVDPGGAQMQQFRDLTFTNDGPTDEHEATEAFSQLLRKAVQRDVSGSQSVGVALSGGIDSAAIAALAVSMSDSSNVHGYALANEFDLAVSAGPADQLPQGERCEAIRASFLASWLGVSYQEHLVRGQDVVEAIPTVIERFAAPHTSSFAPFLLAQRFQSEAPQLISGLGADELLRGYGRSQAIQDQVGPHITADAISTVAHGYFSIDSHLSAIERSAMLHPDVRATVAFDRVAPQTIESLLHGAPEMRVDDACLYLDFKTQMANEYLPTTDLSFGHHSIDVGLPFLDVALVEFVLSLPLSLRSESRRPKYLLRKAIASLLPDGYLDLPKTGFALPIARWVDGPLRPWISEMLNPDAIRSRGWFHPTAVEALISRHERGVDHRSEALWTLAMIETWARRYFDNAPASGDASTRLNVEVGPAILQINAALGGADCTKVPACLDRHLGQHRPLIGDYIGVSVPQPGQTVAAWIDLRNLEYDDYVTAVKRTHKGVGLQNAAKADRSGYVCERFAYPLHVPDIADINHSKAERSAGPMTAPYRRTVDELGGAPTEEVEHKPPDCPLHHDTWWGIFQPEPGHRQGEVLVDRRLVGYIRVRRHGNYALLSKIIGHGDHLAHGIMYRLLLAVMQWLCARDEPAAQGLDHLIYANHEYLPPGLAQWKRKMQFGPALLVEPPKRHNARRADSSGSAPTRVYVPLGENCLADDVVKRHGLDPVITPYSYGRTNLDYAIQLESLGYDRLLDPQHLVAATSGTESVVRNTAVIDCDPIFHPKHDLGFEFTHHDVLGNEADRASLKRKVQRLHDIRGRRSAWFFYHHRIHENADLEKVAAKAERFVEFYAIADGDSRFIVFGQEIVERFEDRGIHRVDHSDRVVSFVMQSMEPWEGDDDDVFWARPDDDLFDAMFLSLGIG